MGRRKAHFDKEINAGEARLVSGDYIYVMKNDPNLGGRRAIVQEEIEGNGHFVTVLDGMSPTGMSTEILMPETRIRKISI